VTRLPDSNPSRRPYVPVGQHPATHKAWALFEAKREDMDVDKADGIDAALRAVSSLFWDRDRERR